MGKCLKEGAGFYDPEFERLDVFVSEVLGWLGCP